VRRWAALRETALLTVFLVAFSRLHAAVGTDVSAATANAHRLLSLERALHLDVEPAMNHWLSDHPALILPAVLGYRLYYAVLLGVLVWVFVRGDDSYLRARRTFMAMAGLALVVFWALPMSPPRLALAGTVDIIARYDVVGGRASRDLGNGQNHFSAMPSLHVGWSAWAAYVVWSTLRTSHPRAALVAWLFPLAMVADVLATGNHFVLDVVGSGVLLVASIAVANVWGRSSRTKLRRRTPG
jgi:PAP2 superfamily